MQKIHILLAGAILLTACKSRQSHTPSSVSAARTSKSLTVALDNKHTLLLLDSVDAARTILLDRYDRFFERVTAAEMSIQMKQPLVAGQAREAMMSGFKQFLQRDMATFSDSEAALVRSTMEEVFKTCMAVAPAVFPDTVVMIKTKGVHYGDGVYYTRDKDIIIPADVLAKPNKATFTSTMFHETFHVYSRLNPAKRKALYQLIGFEGIGYDKLDLPSNLAARVLHNPDGVDFAQKITLTQDGKTLHAVPVIFANQTGFVSRQPAFFGYLEFNLFEIKADERTGRWKAVVAADGYSSTLDLKKLPDFFRQIRDNTGYIIHPDEVLADNFSFLMQSKSNPAVSAKFSAEGKALLTSIESILK
jgi:hypothetical protein